MKCKAKVKDNKLSVKLKFPAGEALSDRELEVLQTKPVRGLLKPNQLRRNVVEYTGPSGVALCDYLKRNISKYEFYYFMAQIVEVTKKVRAHQLFLNRLILDIRYVYVNETTKELQFLYSPIQPAHTSLDVIGFMEAVMYSVKPGEDAGDSVAKYADFLKTQNMFAPDLIEAFISEEETSVGKQIRRYHMSQSSTLHRGGMTGNEAYYSGMADDEATGLLDQEATGLLAEETALLEEEATGLLDENQIPGYQVHFASLTRCVTGEEIAINKPVFRIGKERSYVDYFVDSNQAVSRSHADIITRGGRYYVYDQNSVNHTYINDKMLPVKLEVEIHDGDYLRLANEEFIFHV